MVFVVSVAYGTYMMVTIMLSDNEKPSYRRRCCCWCVFVGAFSLPLSKSYLTSRECVIQMYMYVFAYIYAYMHV